MSELALLQAEHTQHSELAELEGIARVIESILVALLWTCGN